jgi:hypothetical protein
MIFKKKGSRLPGGGWVAFALACAVGLTGCGGAGDSGSSSATTSGTTSGATTGTNTLSLAAAAGQALFNDKSLSVSGKQSCATCHVASRAFTADPATDQGLPVPLGGPNMDIPGFRNAPSLMYASLTPAFFLDAGTPTGGFFRDGRARSLDQQAQQPFITPFEMANQDAAEVYYDMGLCGPFQAASSDAHPRPSPVPADRDDNLRGCPHFRKLIHESRSDFQLDDHYQEDSDGAAARLGARCE